MLYARNPIFSPVYYTVYNATQTDPTYSTTVLHASEMAFLTLQFPLTAISFCDGIYQYKCVVQLTLSVLMPSSQTQLQDQNLMLGSQSGSPIVNCPTR